MIEKYTKRIEDLKKEIEMSETDFSNDMSYVERCELQDKLRKMRYKLSLLQLAKIFLL